MRKKCTVLMILFVILLTSINVYAGDIPESLLGSDEAQIFFAEVLDYYPDKETPSIVVSPVKKIKGDVKEGTQQIYTWPNAVGDFEIYEGNIYLFTYYDEVNPTDIFEVTTYDTRTLKLKHVEGDMWERFEKYLNDGEYGVAWIEGKKPSNYMYPIARFLKYSLAIIQIIFIILTIYHFIKEFKIKNWIKSRKYLNLWWICIIIRFLLEMILKKWW